MQLNLAKFKKIKEDQKGAVLQHPAGHRIAIAKTALSPDLQNQLAKLPLHLAEGDQVPSIDDLSDDSKSNQSPDSPAPVPQAQQPTIIINNTPQPSQGAPIDMSGPKPTSNNVEQPAAPEQSNGDSAGKPDMAVAQKILQDPNVSEAAKNEIRKSLGMEMPAPQAAPEAPAIAEPPSSAPQFTMAPNDPYGMKSYAQNTMEGVQGQMQGIQDQAKAEGDLGRAKADVLGSGIQRQEKVLQDAEQNMNLVNNELDSLINDAKAGHIDPNHYVNSMGTGQKISTAIGLILGGMGGGLMHQENPALKFLNDQIDRDVKGQQMNLDKSNMLFQAYQHQFGNIKSAAEMYGMAIRALTANQLEQKAEQAQDPLSKARAMQSANALKVQNAGIARQFAMQQAMLGGNQGNAGHIDPSIAVRMMIPENQQGAAFKELQTAEAMGHQRDNLINAFDQVNDLNTVGNRAAHLGFEPAKVKALRDPLLAQLVKDAEGRITPQDTEMIKSLFPAPGDNQSTIQLKRSQMLKFVNEKMNFPMLDSFGINVGASGRYNPQGKSRIQEMAPNLP